MRIIIITGLISVALVCWTWAAINLVRTMNLRARAKIVTGTIVDYVSTARKTTSVRSGEIGGPGTRGGSFSGGTFPIVEFKAIDGSLHRFISKTSVRENPPATLEVLYLTEEPQNARVNSFGEMWAVPIAGAAFGLVALLLICLYLLLSRL